MNTPQTRFITLAAMKVTNTDHTAINDNHSKCRMNQKLLPEGRGAERQGGLCRSNIYTSGRGEMTVKLCLVYDMYPQRTRRGKTLKKRVCGKKALQFSYRRREPDIADEIAYGSRCRRNDLHTRLAVRKPNPHYASLALAGRLGVDGQIAPLV